MHFIYVTSVEPVHKNKSLKTGMKMFFMFVKPKLCSKMNEFTPLERKFIPFRVDPFSEGIWCVEKPTGSHKSCLPCNNGRI